MTAHADARASRRGRYLLTLALAALGVVYGDIGTSPLYAIREAFHGTHGIAVTPGNVLGVLSLVFWSLVIVVTIKYHIVIIRADNKGEGGVLALMALVNGSRLARGLTPRRVMIILGIFGSALLYADGALTPAISVLSAVEGLEIAAPALASWVIPGTLVILIGLFLLQSRGTARIGAVFGPVMLVWFATIGVLGLSEILHQPGVLAAISPYYALRFFAEDVHRSFVVLGAVFLVVTGGEALYADLGHFGHRAIQMAWFGVAFPCLLLNYFGQGALLLRDPAAAVNPFYHLADRARDGRHDHRVASGDLRCVLPDAPGGAARLQPAAANRAHVVPRDRPDLRSRGQLGPHGAHLRPGALVPHLEQHRRRVRRGLVYVDAHYDADVLRDEP